MPERTSYTQGTPSWVDVAWPDTDAAAGFYGTLFGWSVSDAGPVEETGGYRMFFQGDKIVAGLGPLTDEQAAEGARPSWTTYLSVDDADKTAALVDQHGGTVVVPPMDVMDAGRMGFFIDPTGVFTGFWQPKQHIGAQLVNEPVSVCWNEHLSHDQGAAKEFLGAVMGLGTTTFPDMEGYEVLTAGEEGVGGITTIPAEASDTQPQWAVVFAVADCDATAAKAAELGATVVEEPNEIPVGRVAVLRDPAGAEFQVIRLAEQG